jgi:hypothetical protein
MELDLLALIFIGDCAYNTTVELLSPRPTHCMEQHICQPLRSKIIVHIGC